jgi:tripartite-type tricarboxylate transporter receptor subunit TctC
MSDFGRVLVVWHATGVKSIDDLKKAELPLGASSRRSTTSIAPMLMNELLGTKFKIVTGYTGTGPTMIALERGEVAATTIAWATVTSLHGDLLRDRKLLVLGGLDLAQVPLPGVPRIRDLIKDDKQRALWDFVALAAEFGTSAVAAPGVPDDKVKILRTAFLAAAQSPEFAAEAKRRKLDINPKSGDELDTLFRQHGSPGPEIVAHVARLMGVTR